MFVSLYMTCFPVCGMETKGHTYKNHITLLHFSSGGAASLSPATSLITSLLPLSVFLSCLPLSSLLFLSHWLPSFPPSFLSFSFPLYFPFLSLWSRLPIILRRNVVSQNKFLYLCIWCKFSLERRVARRRVCRACLSNPRGRRGRR